MPSGPGTTGPQRPQGPQGPQGPGGPQRPGGSGRDGRPPRRDGRPGQREGQAPQGDGNGPRREGEQSRHATGAPQGAPRAGKGAGPRYGKPVTTASLVGWTALSALVPGAAHLRAGKRRTGFILLAVFGALLVAAVVYGLQFLDNAGAAVRSSTLTTVMIGAGAGALAWFALIAMSYMALRPDRLPRKGQIVSGIVVGVLCVSVMSPFALTASYVRTAGDLLDNVFVPQPGGPSPSPIRAEDPWNGRKRVNFLLIGADAAGNREGVRTDSMNVASVNLATGATVLFSLPRNLQYVRFPPSSPMHKQFPNGFNAEGQGLLNAVWYYADNNPQLMGGKNRGAQALKDAIGYTLGLHIDYYAMVDMFGFARLVDAIGGIKIRVEQDVKWGGHYGTAGTIKAGYRKLSGEEALWYGRSRVDSDDFSRMARQRCVIGALAQQASPATVLANFNKIAAAARHMFRTDIPRDLLEHLVPLGLKVKDAKITSLQFVPPVIYTGNPDWAKIRRLTLKAIRESVADSRTSAAGVTASPSGTGTGAGTGAPTGSASATGSPSASTSASPSVGVSASRPAHTVTPTPNDKAAKSLSELCGF
ncbi:LCP family protein [Microtetraspora niveoalba]|uniref:LCP family protein n=1 Tax=Microtetraspora niveoalba TaxID=46175 RepID=UPI000AB5CA1B|nr:LCP family protein [Microtetraspora niveoalba]